MNDTVSSVEKHGTEQGVDQVEVSKLLLNGGTDRYEVEWDAEAKVPPWDRWCSLRSTCRPVG